VVGVGISNNKQPRAWSFSGQGDFKSAEVPSDDQQGEMLDVTTAGATLVAVGWTGTAQRNRAAVWTSTDGAKWDLVPSDGDFKPNSGIKKITAVTTGADGKLLAIARDDRADKTAGDSAVYTSTDGRSWASVAATGLSGSGPQDVNRVTKAGDNSFLAVGAVLQGAGLGPALWKSTDGVKWEQSPYYPDGFPSLQSVAKQANGKMVVCGSIGTRKPPTASCWTQSGDNWERWDIATDPNSPRAMLLYGMYAAGDNVFVVGEGQTGDASNLVTDAGMWTLNFGAHK
jgi:molecular chaperone DnaK